MQSPRGCGGVNAKPRQVQAYSGNHINNAKHISGDNGLKWADLRRPKRPRQVWAALGAEVLLQVYTNQQLRNNLNNLAGSLKQHCFAQNCRQP